jgi:light-harvesting protein B-800-850 beta chain
MSDDPDKVWPTGLTLKEAEEVHSYLIDGTRVFGAIAFLPMFSWPCPRPGSDRG